MRWPDGAVGGHSDPAVAKEVLSDDGLAQKLMEIRGTLQQRLRVDCQALLGVPLPDNGLLDIQDYDLISTQTSVGAVVSGYESGGESLVQARIDDHALGTAAMGVLRSVLGLVETQGSVSVGGYVASRLTNSGGKWASAVICEVELGRRQDWNTPVDFFIISFGFFVWMTRAAEATITDPFVVSARHWPPR